MKFTIHTKMKLIVSFRKYFKTLIEFVLR